MEKDRDSPVRVLLYANPPPPPELFEILLTVGLSRNSGGGRVGGKLVSPLIGIVHSRFNQKRLLIPRGIVAPSGNVNPWRGRIVICLSLLTFKGFYFYPSRDLKGLTLLLISNIANNIADNIAGTIAINIADYSAILLAILSAIWQAILNQVIPPIGSTMK